MSASAASVVKQAKQIERKESVHFSFIGQSLNIQVKSEEKSKIIKSFLHKANLIIAHVFLSTKLTASQ
jgi:hypothetical protein